MPKQSKQRTSPLLRALRQCSAAPVLCIVDGPEHGVFLSDAELDWLGRTNATILYASKANLQAQLDKAPALEALKPVAAIVSDLEEISQIYRQAQDITRAIVDDLTDGLEPALHAEVLPLRETIALKAADYSASILLTHLALRQIVPDLAARPVLLVGNSQSGYGLQALLAQQGVKAAVVPLQGPRSRFKHRWRQIRRAAGRQIRTLVGRALGHMPLTDTTDRFQPRLIGTPDHAPTQQEVAARLSAVVQDGKPLCMVDSDAAYLQALRSILQDAPDRVGVIAIGEVRSTRTGELLAHEVLTEAPPVPHPHFDLGFLEAADLRLQDAADRQALQDRAEAWIRHQRVHQDLECRLGMPTNFMLCRISETLNLLADVIMVARIYRDVLDRARPSAILLMPQRLFQARVLADVARARGIVTFDLPVGTMARSHIQWRTGCDYIFVPDTGSSHTQTEFFNLPEERVRIIGAPRMDARIAELRAQSGQPRPRHSLFLALQHLDLDHNFKLISACAEAAERLAGSLTVGLHPRELEQTRQALTEHCLAQGDHVRMAEGASLYELPRHEICITFFSFIAYEAYALGARVITLNLSGKPWTVRLSESGFAEEACSTEELLDLLQCAPCQSEVDPRNQVLRDGGSVRRLHADMAGLPVIPDPRAC